MGDVPHTSETEIPRHSRSDVGFEGEVVDEITSDQYNAASAEIEERLSHVREVARNSIRDLSKDQPPTIYHYTTSSGLLGILSTNRLFATHASYVNDTTEISYCVSLIDDALDECLGGDTTEAGVELVRRVRATVNVFEGYLGAFISCFCEDGDLLSQWRGYSGDQTGYALGFSTRELSLRWHDLRPEQRFDLVRVIYDESEQRSRISQIVGPMWKVFNVMLKSKGEIVAYAAMPSCCKFLEQELLYYLVSFKSPAFEEEKEWRLVYLRTLSDEADPLRFRPVGSLLVPYVELDPTPQAGVNTGRVPLGDLVCGPTAHPELVVRAADMLLRHQGIAFAQVRPSAIPLRP